MRATTAARAPTGRCRPCSITTTATAVSRTPRNRRASPRHSGRGWASPWGTTTATAGRTSMSRTTPRRTSYGSTGTTAHSWTTDCSRARRSTRPATRRAAWGSPPAISTATATRTSSSPTSPARPSRCTSTTERETSRTRGRAPASRRRPRRLPASERTGSTTTTTGVPTCLSPTAR